MSEKQKKIKERKVKTERICWGCGKPIYYNPNTGKYIEPVEHEVIRDIYYHSRCRKKAIERILKFK